jgi:hypothetical protein
MLLVSLAVFVTVAVLPAQAGKKLADLAVDDVLARPGQPVELRAKLESNSIAGTDLKGARVEFRLDGKVLGTALTDDDGVALFRVDAPLTGDHSIKASFEGNEDYLRAEYLALLAVRRADDAMMVLDIDWTISMTDNLNTALGSSDSPPLRNAPEVVERLAGTYSPVYVTARARQLRKRTLSWLNRYGFPRGPVFFLEPKRYPTYNEAAYKAAVLVPMKKTFPGLRFGVGNKESDVESHQAAGLPCLLISGRAIPGGVSVSHWDLAEEAVTRMLAPPKAR